MPTPTRVRALHRAPRLDFIVPAELIATACKRNSSHCMIAEALQAAIPAARFVSVDLATIRFTDEAAGWRYIYLTPRPAQAALLAFDQGEPIEPFRVAIRAAQMLPTGSARKARRAQEVETAAQEGRKPRNAARTLDTRDGGGTVPVVVGGHRAPPLGPLAAESADVGEAHATAHRNRRRNNRRSRREYGLRVFVR